MGNQERTMTLATGQQSNRRRAGFTLIELILVLALLVIAVSIVSPRVSGFIRGRALHSEAHRLLAVIRAGQSRAISEGLPAAVWIQAEKGRYGLASETPNPRSDLHDLEFSTDSEIELSVTGNLPATVTFRDSPAIRWLPDGFADEGSANQLELRDSTGASLWLVGSLDRRTYAIRNQTN